MYLIFDKESVLLGSLHSIVDCGDVSEQHEIYRSIGIWHRS